MSVTAKPVMMFSNTKNIKNRNERKKHTADVEYTNEVENSCRKSENSNSPVAITTDLGKDDQKLAKSPIS